MYVERGLKDRFHRLSDHYGMVAVVGARQAGKTTFLKHQMGTDSSYVLFDDPDARTLFDEDIKRFALQYLEGHDLGVLDEVQYCKDAGSKLKYLVDSGSRLWVTSSSEVLLAKDVLSHLVGRVSVVRMHPFSLPEFISARGMKAPTERSMKRVVWEHLTYGGYPKVVTTEDQEMKRTILRDLHETMLLKDVAQTFSIDDINALERCALCLSNSVGSLISSERVASDLGISVPTVNKYLDAMEKSYLITMVKPFFTNKRKEIVKQPKVYFQDTGLRNVIAKRYDTEPDGRLFENYVLTELIRMDLTPKHWRTKTKAEVDFVIESDGGPIPVEAKLKAGPGRVDSGLRSFIRAYEPGIALVVSYGGSKGETEIGGCRVLFTDVPGLRNALGNGDR